MESIGQINHTLAQLNTNQYFKVCVDLREKLGSSHSNFDDRNGVKLTAIFNVSSDIFKELDLFGK